jgi:hypothetical protein
MEFVLNDTNTHDAWRSILAQKNNNKYFPFAKKEAGKKFSLRV